MSNRKQRNSDTGKNALSAREIMYGNIQIGARIRNIRLELDMSQDIFAELIGISPSYLSSIERGVRRVSARICTSIHQVTGLSCDYILTGQSDEFHYNSDRGKDTSSSAVFEQGVYQISSLPDLSPSKRRLLLLFSTCTDPEAILCYNVCHSMLSALRSNSSGSSARISNPGKTGAGSN